MIANVTKTNLSRVLVAVLAMALVVVGAAVVFSDNTVNATSYDDAAELQGALNAERAEEVTLDNQLTITGDFTVPEGVTLIVNGAISATDANLVVNGTITNNAGIYMTNSDMSGFGTINGTSGMGILIYSGSITGVNFDASSTAGGSITITPVANVTVSNITVTIDDANATTDHGIYVNPYNGGAATISNVTFNFNGNDAVPINTDVTSDSKQYISDITFNNVNRNYKVLFNAYTADTDATNIAITVSPTGNVWIENVTDVCFWSAGYGNNATATFTISENVSMTGVTVEAYGDNTTLVGNPGADTTVFVGASEVSDALNKYDSVEVTSGEVSGTVAIPEGKELIVSTTISSGASITLASESVVTVNATSASTFSITNNDGTTNTISFNNVVGNFTISQGSINIAGEFNEGTMEVTGVAYLIGDVVIDSGVTLTINSGASLSTKGYTFTNEGTVKNNGTFTNNGIVYNNGTFTNNGIVYNNGTFTNNATLNNYGQIYTQSAISNVTGNPVVTGFGIANNMDAIESNLDLTGYAFLTSDLTIPEGKSITVGSNATLDLRGFTLTVEGQLIVQVGGTVIGYTGDPRNLDNEIVLNGGSITNNGVIGYGNVPVTVSGPNGNGEVELLNVEGVSFSTVKINSVNYLSVSGDVIAAVSTYEDNVFNINGAYVDGELTISDEITSTITATVNGDATLTIDGTVTSGTITMLNNSTVIINGDCNATIKAATGKFESTDSPDSESTVELDDVTGITLSVSSTSAVEQPEGYDEPTRFTTRVLNISGNVDYDSDTENGSITIGGNGIVYVPTDTELVIPEDVNVDMGGAIVNGTVEYITNTTTCTIFNFVGAQYQVGTGNDTVYYIKSFEGALGEIANAYRNTINIYGPVEVTSDVTLTDGQTIAVQPRAGDNNFVIAEEATVTIQSGARITGTVNLVEGTLIAERGGNVQVVQKYAVYSQSTDGTRIYSGFAAALERSQAGDTITVSGTGYGADEAVKVSSNVTIEADRTVVIQHLMEFSGNLTINEGATVTNQSTIDMTGRNSTITVNGVLDSSANTADIIFTYEDAAGADTSASRNINVSGEFIVASVSDLTIMDDAQSPTQNAYVNGVYYTNDENQIVVTSFAGAIAAVTNADSKVIIVIGNVSESGDFSVDGGEDVFCINVGTSGIEATANLGNITIRNAQIAIADGSKLTATVNGTYGIDAATSTVQLNGVTDLTVENSSAPNSLAEDVWFTRITSTVTSSAADICGAVTVSAGQVILGNATATYSVHDENADRLTVSSGATLVVPEGITLNLGAKTVIEGTITVEGTVDVPAGSEAVVSGTINVTEGSLTVAAASGSNVAGKLTITGVLNVGEDATAVTISGTLYIGETPRILGSGVSSTGTVTGKVSTGTSAGTIIVYNGTDVSGANFANGNTDIASTQFMVNGGVYATVYSSSADYDVLDTEIEGLDDLNIGDGIEWYSGETLVETGTIGEYEVLSTEIAYGSVSFTVSIGSGISLSVDNVIINGWNGRNDYQLSIGTHTISAVTNPGYTGDIVITFNGQTISNDGTFEVTSEMAGQNIVISASGNISLDTGSSGSSGSSDDGMGLTDYLLIILVVLIVIMAIMVAMRLMRS